MQGCRFVPEKYFRKLSPTDGTKLDLNIGVSPGFGGLILGKIYSPDSFMMGRKLKNLIHLQQESIRPGFF